MGKNLFSRFAAAASASKPLLLLVIYVAGGGHGYYEPALFLFPWALLSILWSNSIYSPFLFLALLQFPLYGLVLDNGEQSELAFNRRLFVIIVFHLALTGLLYAYWPHDKY